MRILLTICLLLAFSPIQGDDSFQKRIDAALQSYFPNIQNQNVSIEELKGGLSSAANFKVVVDGRSYVLRLQDQSYPDDNLGQWLLTAYQAGLADIGPKLYWIAPDASAIFMEYLEGESFTVETAKIPENIVNLGRTVRAVHTLPPNPTQYWPFFYELEYAFSILQEWNFSNPDLESLMAEARAINAELDRRDYPVATVHGDLVSRNIFLTDSGVRIIDWAETSLEDPIYDVSNCAISFDFTDMEEQLFLESYFGGPLNEDQQSHYAMVKRLNLIGFAIFLPYIAYDWSQEEGIALDLSGPVEDWSWYSQFYAHTQNPIGPQFYYDCGKSILQRLLMD